MNSYIGFDDLVDLGPVDFNMNYLCLLCILTHIAGDPVVKAHSDANQYITFVGIYIRPVIAMHSKKADIVRMIRGESAQPEQGGGDRYAGLFREGNEFLCRARQQHTLSGEAVGALRLVDQFGGGFYFRKL